MAGTATRTNPEKKRLDRRQEWRRWGPYLSERAWGTVREDYSEEGDAWQYFPHEHARSRAYRWSEDGLGGICDEGQRLCFAFAFWNEQDPILKERIFGLTGPEGNHGEDAKEYWWYVDATPSHSWLTWRYRYPHGPFPYRDLVEVNRSRSREEPEYELVDTGIFDSGRYWDITVDYAKATPEDICIRLKIANAGPDSARLHVLPSLWFRNTWSWKPGSERPCITDRDGALLAQHEELGFYLLSGSGASETLFCENESNAFRLWGEPAATPYPKDGIGDHVTTGAATVNPHATGTKASLHYVVDVPGGQAVEIRLRLAATERPDPAAAAATGPGAAALDLGLGWAGVLQARREEANFFYESLLPVGTPDQDAHVVRQACAGMIWGQQFFHYDVERWLEGDPSLPSPPRSRMGGRNSGWRHLNNHDVISMPDTWEYPWYASWDLAFHAVVLAYLDPDLAKDQLILLGREWYMHPNGQLPAYEWNFSDVNPPVQAWATLRVFEIDGGKDYEFLERVMHKLVLNFNWWVNRKDSQGSNVFEGGFLGLDNIGPIDRSAGLPVGDRLEQSDGTAWMAMFCLNLLEMSLTLAGHDQVYEDLATKFFEHFTYIAAASSDQGLWDEEEGFYYDVLQTEDGRRIPLRVRSLVGMIPLCAVTVLDAEVLDRLPGFAARMQWFVDNKPHYAQAMERRRHPDGRETLLLSVVSPQRLGRILNRALSEEEFLSPFGLRSVSAYHREHPFVLDFPGLVGQVDYEPAESRTGLFGGNSNWRGPVWVPLNYLVIEALRRFHQHLGSGFTVGDSTRSGPARDLGQVAADLGRRLLAIFLPGPDGRRPVYGSYDLLASAGWEDLVPFHEYFHGDTGAGLGASHQTGWTGLVADVVLDRR
jgi:hypothetical protein